MSDIALHLAALGLVGISITHSWLGERYLLMRLFRRTPLPRTFGSEDFTRRTLRFAWHVTSVAWLGFAALLLMLARAPVTSAQLGTVVAANFAAHGLVSLHGSRGRHYSWVVFFGVAVLSYVATR